MSPTFSLKLGMIFPHYVSSIFAVQDDSTKTTKIMDLKNLVLHSIHVHVASFPVSIPQLFSHIVNFHIVKLLHVCKKKAGEWRLGTRLVFTYTYMEVPVPVFLAVMKAKESLDSFSFC